MKGVFEWGRDGFQTRPCPILLVLCSLLPALCSLLRSAQGYMDDLRRGGQAHGGASGSHPAADIQIAVIQAKKPLQSGVKNPGQGNHGQQLGSVDVAAQLQADFLRRNLFEMEGLVVEQNGWFSGVKRFDEPFKIG